MTKTTLIFLLLLTMLNPLKAQAVFEPLNKDIYSYLERLSNKGIIIELDDLFKPLSRKYIAEKLVEIKSKVITLTELEKEELEFFEKDYYWEINIVNGNRIEKNLSYFGSDSAERYRIFSYGNDLFKFNANPVLGLKVAYLEKDRNINSTMGLHTYGYLLNNIGFSLDIRSNNEKGNALGLIVDTAGGSLKYLRPFTPETGIIPEVHDKGRDIGYSEVNSSISADWGWGQVTVAKEHLEYGYAKFGNLVLSNKAPSFPHIRMHIKPADWFNFYYFHAWLSSNVIDSVNRAAYKRDIFINKYFAWHALVVTPLEGFDISVGESVVYSDQLELTYLMPVMFYFFADEYISNRQGKPGDANQQIFLSVSSKNHLYNTHIYGTLFVDEMTIGGINGSLFVNTNYGGATSRRERTQLGYTLGLSITDLPIDNLTLTTEYTRINPFVYGHHDPAQTYKNSSYLMGHWMGHNSDLIYLDLNYRFIRGLQANLWGAYIRKGSDDYSQQYGSTQPEFLFGLKNYYTYFGLNIRYELVHELNVDARFKLTKISSEQNDGSFVDDQKKEFSISVFYGL